ncbi:hypothetical protein SAMN06273572_104101 [Monaibacterium marinum]|uniref:Lipoprotein n=1 Tax=Pontivivens marinum TaxID=1690039 RepID=A0A2C9CT58_9RHOB|nr:DUF3299 domain-containing protein [Monaibacterium marinum]SOH94403.1 hypothetical protein SAMN06273572_104101 [Monaibacterium marinum]
MVNHHLNRRLLMAGMGALALIPQIARAQDYIDLSWSDLVPEGQPALPPALQSLIDHDQAPMNTQQPRSTGVRNEWNGQIVRLPGFIVPIEYSGTGVTAFILVPFVGACVHVPPPPANQLVFVTTERPYQSEGLFEPVSVTGMFGVSSMSTELAEIGYALSADLITPYQA